MKLQGMTDTEHKENLLKWKQPAHDMGTLENDKTWLYKALTQDHNINSDNLASNEREKLVGTKHYQSSSSFFFLSAIPHNFNQAQYTH